jgi:hypothetical protein
MSGPPPNLQLREGQQLMVPGRDERDDVQVLPSQSWLRVADADNGLATFMLNASITRGFPGMLEHTYVNPCVLPWRPSSGSIDPYLYRSHEKRVPQNKTIKQRPKRYQKYACKQRRLAGP